MNKKEKLVFGGYADVYDDHGPAFDITVLLAGAIIGALVYHLYLKWRSRA